MPEHELVNRTLGPTLHIGGPQQDELNAYLDFIDVANTAERIANEETRHHPEYHRTMRNRELAHQRARDVWRAQQEFRELESIIRHNPRQRKIARHFVRRYGRH